MSQEPDDTRRSAKRAEVDNTLEDAFGVNFRALRTLKDIVIRPNVVFASYAANDRVTYTPAIRLFVGLIAVQVFVSFLWGGYAGLLISQWEAQPGVIPQMEGLFRAPISEIAEHYGNAATFLHAILVGSFTALSAFLVGAFNKSLGWVARLNITFAILTGGTVVGLLGLILAAGSGLMVVVGWMPFVIFISYWIFFVRGARGVLTTTMTGTLVKGGLFAAVTMIYVFLGGIFMALIAMTYAYFRINGGG
ncbi:MAG: DUF3667 domain-containing protein [Alphaproteobacteria bacterium]|nr:DUF3667 domain-containing protein [Alphaproteobacteria bacterium]